MKTNEQVLKPYCDRYWEWSGSHCVSSVCVCAWIAWSSPPRRTPSNSTHFVHCLSYMRTKQRNFCCHRSSYLSFSFKLRCSFRCNLFTDLMEHHVSLWGAILTPHTITKIFNMCAPRYSFTAINWFKNWKASKHSARSPTTRHTDTPIGVEVECMLYSVCVCVCRCVFDSLAVLYVWPR